MFKGILYKNDITGATDTATNTIKEYLTHLVIYNILPVAEALSGLVLLIMIVINLWQDKNGKSGMDTSKTFIIFFVVCALIFSFNSIYTALLA